MKAALTLILAAVVCAGGWHEIGVHHIGAPADPYPGSGQSCPAGSRYVSAWYPESGYAEQATGNAGSELPPAGPGVVYYHGWIEIATCGASISGAV